MVYLGNLQNKRLLSSSRQYTDSIYVFLHLYELPTFWDIQPLPLAVAFWARLAEIGVRITFIALTCVAALIYEEIDEEISDLAEQSVIPDDQGSLERNSDRLIDHYDLACRLVEQINRCFASVLLIITATDFTIAIFEFFQIFITLRREGVRYNNKFYETADELYVARNSDGTINVQRITVIVISFVHVIFRFFAILAASHHATSKVNLYNIKPMLHFI